MHCLTVSCCALWLFDVDISSMTWLKRFWRAILNFSEIAEFEEGQRKPGCWQLKTSYNHCWCWPWTCPSTVCSAATAHSVPRMLHWIAANWMLHEPTTTCLQFLQLLKLVTCKSVYNVNLHAKNNPPFVPWVNWALTLILQFQNVLFITQFHVLSVLCAIFCISVSYCSCSITVCLPCHWL